jgi:DNA polymerase elongation subunit (family B)
MQQDYLSKILFLDIETVPQTADIGCLNEEMQHLWEEKFEALRRRSPEKYADVSAASDAFGSAGIFAEFGKIICISVGFIHFEGNKTCFRTKSYTNVDEKELLLDFSKLVTSFCSQKNYTLCGHNIKEFDIPYICRRMLINNIPLPGALQIAGKKPWEISFIDTMELWKFGDYKHYTSLKLLTAVFGIKTPKDDIDGSMVAHVYYAENDIDRIARYCQKDVLATAQVFLRMNAFGLIDDEHVEHI